MEDLDVKLRDELDLMFRETRAKMNSGDKDDAARLAEIAWQQFPEPKFGWDVSKSFTHALTEIYKDAGRYEDALKLMNKLFVSGYC